MTLQPARPLLCAALMAAAVCARGASPDWDGSSRASGSILEAARQAAASGPRADAPGFPSGAAAGGAGSSGILGGYRLVTGKDRCESKLSVALVPQGLRVWSPDELKDGEDPARAVRLRGSSELYASSEDDFVKGGSRIRFKGPEMTLTYRGKGDGRPLEMGFWQSLGLKGRKLDANLDCLYAKAGDAPWQEPPVTFHRYRFRVKGALCGAACILSQSAVLTVAFEMESVKDVHSERRIRGLEYALELLPGGDIPAMPGYTMRSAAPVSGRSRQAFPRDEMDFFLEAPARTDAGARGTVLDAVAFREASLRLDPYCSSGLKACRLGALAGLDMNGSGRAIHPDFRMLSNETFAISLEPANP